MTAQGSAYTRFRRALDRGNVTEALSAASELGFVGLAEALELTLLLADKEAEKYDCAAARGMCASSKEVPNVEEPSRARSPCGDPGEPARRRELAELLSRRRSCERIAEALVRWARAA